MNATHHPYRAGFGKADITPAAGIQLGGDIGRRRPVESIRMPLSARALVITHEDRTLCLLQLDVLGIADTVARDIAEEIARMLGTEPDAVMIHSCQSHSSPAVGHFWAVNPSPHLPESLWWLRGGDDRYIGPFRKGALKAVAAAQRSQVNASLHIGRGADGRAAFNRRFIMRDGSTKTHPPVCSPDILHCEGPTDPEVGVAVFRNRKGKAIGAILHHTCHPCHGYPERWVHPDWPGAWAENFASAIGAPGRALTLNGFCGNQHHRNHLDPDQQDTIEAMTAYLTDTAVRVEKTCINSQTDQLTWSTRWLSIPWRSIPREKLKEAKVLLKQHPQPIWQGKNQESVHWDWCYAVALLDLKETQRSHATFDYAIQVFRIGDLALVAWPGEPFVEAQLAIKRISPAPFLFTAHMNGLGGIAGYQMNRNALQNGGYETWVANTSRLSPKTPDLAHQTTKEMLEQLF